MHCLATANAHGLVGVTGDTDEEVFENFIVKIEELKARVGIKKTIRDYGVTEEDFLATLDEMCEQAFDDSARCKSPYPLISEIKANVPQGILRRDPGRGERLG